MNLPLKRESIVICGLALLIGGGYWQGRASGRWHPTQAPVVDLASVASSYEGWTVTDFELPKQTQDVAGIDGYLARRYQNLETGEVINVMILTGPGGPISVHPPDVCFAGQGYRRESHGARTTIKLNGTSGMEHEFETTIFRGPPSTDGHRLQLYWAWSSDGVWKAPSSPRLTFAREPRLYKMYVSRTLHPAQDRDENQTCLELMQRVADDFAGFFPKLALKDR
jgi:hypothetical protein